MIMGTEAARGHPYSIQMVGYACADNHGIIAVCGIHASYGWGDMLEQKSWDHSYPWTSTFHTDSRTEVRSI